MFLENLPEHFSIIEFDVENNQIIGRLVAYQWNPLMGGPIVVEGPWNNITIVLYVDEYGRLAPTQKVMTVLEEEFNPIYTKVGKLWWPR